MNYKSVHAVHTKSTYISIDSLHWVFDNSTYACSVCHALMYVFKLNCDYLSMYLSTSIWIVIALAITIQIISKQAGSEGGMWMSGARSWVRRVVEYGVWLSATCGWVRRVAKCGVWLSLVFDRVNSLLACRSDDYWLSWYLVTANTHNANTCCWVGVS